MPRWYLFGCLTVNTRGAFTFKSAPDGTFFAGDRDRNWVTAMEDYC